MGDEKIRCEPDQPKTWKENVDGVIVDCSEGREGNRLEYSFECTIGGVLRKHGFCSDREFTREELKQRPEFRSVLTDEIDGKVHTAVAGR
jgi:hypothetical protein